MMSKTSISRRTFISVGTGAAAVAALAGLAGCAGGSGSGSAASASASSSAEASAASEGAGSSASAAAPAGETVTITDLRGDTVDVPVKIEKIADLWHAHNQIVLMLGAGPKLVGTTENFKKRPWANVVFPQIADVAALVVGTGAGEVNYEEALNLEPDVVFASDPDVTDSARSQGLTTVNVMFQDYEGLRNDVKLTAEILGEDAVDIATEWEALLDENIKLVADRMKDVDDADKVKVLHIVNPSAFTTVDGLNNIVDEWIKLAGGVNALTAEGNMIEVTMEDIVAADPEVIIIGSGAAQAVKDLMADEAWSGITAVKNGAVYANPSGVFAWDRYSGEEALQVLWAAKKLNPDKFEDVDMAQVTKDFYKEFYGYELSDEDAERILNGEDPA